VLICRKGSALPFDVKLSRVIFYDFDGVNLDWEEVERVVKQMAASLKEAQRGAPDSPVYALLESVVRPDDLPPEQSVKQCAEDSPDGQPLENYQKLVAQCWKSQGSDIDALLEENRGSLFGSRAIAYRCLDEDPLPKAAKWVANHLNDGQQYRLANRLYARLVEAGDLTRGSRLAYASSYSEANPDIAGADQAIAMAEEVLAEAEAEFARCANDPEAIRSLAECYRRLAGLRQWRWQLSREGSDLDRALATFAEATRYNDRARALGVMRHPGFIAQLRIKEMLLLRIRDDSIDRPDGEGHQDAILALSPQPQDDPVGLSYLGWFQAVTLADMGAGEQANRRALKTFVEDAELRNAPRYWEIGGRQYTLLRRFLEQYASHLRNPSLIGGISQLLQSGGLNG
jgi:hypothetical protein